MIQDLNNLGQLMADLKRKYPENGIIFLLAILNKYNYYLLFDPYR